MGVRLGGLSEGANKRYAGRGERDNGGVETREMMDGYGKACRKRARSLLSEPGRT